MWLLGCLPGHCFCNPAGRGDELPVANAGGSTAALRATGPMARANPLRFSTRYRDDETDLLYYGYRYYNASTGRWLSRDPLGEAAGPNGFCFVENTPVSRYDNLGLYDEGFAPLGEAGARTSFHIKVDVTQVSVSGCCCKLVSATFSPVIRIDYNADINATIWKQTTLQQMRAHETVHADADVAITDAGMPYAICVLQSKCLKRWFGSTWTVSKCKSAQQEELQDAANSLRKSADGEMQNLAHQYIGAYPKNWNPAGIPAFQNDLAAKLLVKFYPGPHCQKFW
jgi:RHS repeat-associated protein